MNMIQGKTTIRTFMAVCLFLIIGGFNFACSAQTRPDTSPKIPIPSPLPSVPPPAAVATKVQFLGQACFSIISGNRLKVITDPYTPGNSINYAPINEGADIVTVSHGHADHSNVAGVQGQPQVVRDVGVTYAKGMDIKGIATWHDDVKGAQRGANTVFVFAIDGVRYCHLGDLGHRLSPEQLAGIGQVDVVFIPVGGNFTIDAKMATEVCNDLKPRIVIPMHYKTAQVTLQLAPVDDFLKGKDNVRTLNTSTLEIRAGELPAVTTIMVLEPAR
jgi:L-ascorbate metabolism protein UlaG (beta-lactamase superfamily)